MTTVSPPQFRTRPWSIIMIAFFGSLSGLFGLLSFLGGLFWSLASHSFVPHDAEDIFSLIWGIIGFPLDVVLLAGTLGILWAKGWARQWLMRWSIVAACYSTVQLIITLVWIAPNAAAHNMAQLGDLKGQIGPDYADMITMFVKGEVWITPFILFASNISLVVWIPWALTRPQIRPFFDFGTLRSPSVLPIASPSPQQAKSSHTPKEA